MLPQGKIGIGLQMPGQPLSQGLALHRGPAGDLVYVDVPRKAPSLVPALDGRTRDPKELCNLLSWDAAVYCGEHFQSEVPRIGVHGGILMRVRYLRKPLLRAKLTSRKGVGSLPANPLQAGRDGSPVLRRKGLWHVHESDQTQTRRGG